jgi:OmcA/MtrC family decaheme c-type cytochrome
MRLAAPRAIARACIPLIALIALAAGLTACSGSTGPAGAAGAIGATGPTGPQGQGLDPVASITPESCATCHADVGAQGHQAIYNKYTDTTTLVMAFGYGTTPAITNVVVVPPVAPATTPTYNATLNFSITKNGLPYIDADQLPSMLQRTFYAVAYRSANRQFHASSSMSYTKVASNKDGTYKLAATGLLFDPTTPATADCTPPGGTPPNPCDGSIVYGYIAQDLLPLESYTPATHYQLYANLSSAAYAFGTAMASNANTYVSNADVTACQGCHGTPYRKHGYREAIVGNGVATPTTANEVVKDFAPCKACHYDDRPGSDKVWQQMVNDPYGWATGKAIATTDYPYYATLMNDTHMSHSMEFPYPQSMAICSTCHTGSKLANVLDNKYFQAATCKSCHPVTDDSKPIAPATKAYKTEPNRAPSLPALWAATQTPFHTTMALDTTDCTTCHSATAKIARTLNQYHTGYDAPTNYNAAVYDATIGSATFGQQYASLYGAKIDSATLTGTCTATSTSGCVLDIVFEPTFTAPGTSAVAATIVPTVSASFYGYDTKDFLISRHTPGTAPTANCPDFTGAPAGCTMEYTIGTKKNSLFTEVARTDGKWEVKLDIAAWIPAAGATGTIPAEIVGGRIKKAEIAVQPALTIGGAAVALNGVTQTVDVSKPGTGGALATVKDYFQGANAIVDVNKCNNCHDALGPTFHGGQYGGSIVLCRTCHVPTSGAVTQEVQSRSIDSFVHAIHSFQGFNTGSIDFTDAVATRRYTRHIEHIFPNFTAKNCEGCHVTSNFTDPPAGSSHPGSPFPVTYNVPDQATTIPGPLSASATLSKGWFGLDASGNYAGTATDRNISGVPKGIVPSYVTGPASRACGGCHRAKFVKEDDVNGLVSFNQHTNMGGYMVDTTQTSTTWTSVTAYVYGVISHVMALF